MPADDRKPEQVLKPEYLREYTTAHNDIWYRLVHVNTSIQILEIIASYPVDHLFDPSEAVFLKMLYWNFNYTCIVMLYAILDDPEGLTLNQFKNTLIKKWLPEKEQQFFRAKLKNCRFSAKCKRLKSRLQQIRHKVIAHRDPKIVNGSLRIPVLSIADLRTLYNETEALFSACSFHAEYETRLYVPCTVGDKPVQKDIEYIMDLLVYHSFWLNQPERDIELWPELRKSLTEKELLDLNTWRVKLGLPPA